ncbi:TPA: hypothetical protein N0F65_009302 [Lagenidium giganteum]|uniref:Uncharacterized protein n=1 Tax=Lagenidium giganteum TaxID=4803 RepID=A0AAV2YP89_9STRA|nr:TPA: hypothetical protein N0F65_009302 [Lagenidium giganteum]
MSAMIPEVAPSSFFPTPHEVAGGIRWIREHPVMATAAAAAATAVSVITFLKKKSDEYDELCPVQQRHSHTSDSSSDLSHDDDDEQPPARERGLTWSDTYQPRGEEACLLERRPRKTQSQQNLAAFYPTKAPRLEREEVLSSTESEMSTTRRVSEAEPEYSARSCEIEPPNSQSLEADYVPGDDSTTSPQWGWYVSTTPPEEYYA